MVQPGCFSARLGLQSRNRHIIRSDRVQRFLEFRDHGRAESGGDGHPASGIPTCRSPANFESVK